MSLKCEKINSGVKTTDAKRAPRRRGRPLADTSRDRSGCAFGTVILSGMWLRRFSGKRCSQRSAGRRCLLATQIDSVTGPGRPATRKRARHAVAIRRIPNTMRGESIHPQISSLSFLARSGEVPPAMARVLPNHERDRPEQSCAPRLGVSTRSRRNSEPRRRFRTVVPRAARPKGARLAREASRAANARSQQPGGLCPATSKLLVESFATMMTHARRGSHDAFRVPAPACAAG